MFSNIREQITETWNNHLLQTPNHITYKNREENLYNVFKYSPKRTSPLKRTMLIPENIIQREFHGKRSEYYRIIVAHNSYIQFLRICMWEHLKDLQFNTEFRQFIWVAVGIVSKVHKALFPCIELKRKKHLKKFWFMLNHNFA